MGGEGNRILQETWLRDFQCSGRDPGARRDLCEDTGGGREGAVQIRGYLHHCGRIACAGSAALLGQAP